MIFQVRIPQGVGPGQKFRCLVNGQHHEIVCPPNAVPGQSIQFQVSDQYQPTQSYSQTQQYATNPPQGYTQQPPQSAYYPQSHTQSPEAIYGMVDVNRSGQINIQQLKQAMDLAGYNRFQMKTCKLMMSMFDTDQTMTMSPTEFSSLYKYVTDWENCFKQYDRDRSGSVTHDELKTAVQAFGYRFSDSFFQTLFNKYDEDNSKTISFDEFIQLFCELHLLTEAFKVHDTKRQGVATFKYEDFLKACFAIHT
mmetsp:Transcript_16838/g.20775  ORF Transcript_16838/g.20775 Transcript_16838/m.20775 type:complete len:251 (+) Transcript_16838:406-1158(+)|eukprot:CAMPEP_0204854374 /NCGR_PEP_ID=MMETSP1347-20130617/15061_1 /ASSEMBLY_ACC=CAM_ASM_000690 /TAXON_ID=215587 /ORGANISM="Aplanochytrium stocchinoi, Strain GSBS06" /LENGTH=250 /DNA_ID=CAMNT_0051999903 /DNA_START=377 /DNA_END=1129 /DNA_ORIENTATION=-